MFKAITILVLLASAILTINFFVPDSSAKSAFETIQKRCTLKQVQNLKIDLFGMTTDKIGKPKKDIDGKVAKAQKRYQRKIAKGGMVNEDIELATASAILKKEEVESKLKEIIDSINSMNCENRNDKKQELRRLYAESFNLLEEYKQLKNLLVQLVNKL